METCGQNEGFNQNYQRPGPFTAIPSICKSEVLGQGYEQRYKVVELVVHPQFNKRHLTNDIAVMWIRSEKYNQTVRYSDQVLPVCLPELSNPVDEFYKSGVFGIVSGWGLLNETDNKGSNSLQHVALPMLSPDKCLEAYGRFVDMDENKQVKVAKSQKVLRECSSLRSNASVK